MKDVTEGLARASAAAGIDTHVFLPYYRVIDGNKSIHVEESDSFRVSMNYPHEKRTESVTMCNVRLEENLTIHLVKTDRYRYLTEGSDKIERHGIYQYTGRRSQGTGKTGTQGQGLF